MKKILFFSLIFNTNSWCSNQKQEDDFSRLPNAIRQFCMKNPDEPRVKQFMQTLKETPKSNDTNENKQNKIYRFLRLLMDKIGYSWPAETERLFQNTLKAYELSDPQEDEILEPLQAKPIENPDKKPGGISFFVSSEPGTSRDAQPRLRLSRAEYPILINESERIKSDELDIAPYKSSLNFSNIAGGVPDEIRDLKKILSKNPHYMATGVRIPSGILFYGPPGMGKSLLIKAIAGELKVPIILRSGSSFIDRYVGEGANALRNLFINANNLLSKVESDKECKHKLVIIGIDEIDAVGGQRKKDGNSEYNNTLAELLTLMSGDGGLKFDKQRILVMATTNRVDVLDEALLRPGRLDYKILISKPDQEKRAEVLRHHFYVKERKVDDVINFEQIAKQSDNFSCADLEKLVDDAARIAARNKRGIMNQDFDDAIKSIRDANSTAISEDVRRMYG